MRAMVAAALAAGEPAVKAPQVRRGILFSGPMVRAILAGRKTQTRRAMRTSHVGYHSFARWDGEPFRRAMMRCLNDPGIATGNPSCGRCSVENNRYGVPGDRLWVRRRTSHCYFDDSRPEALPRRLDRARRRARAEVDDGVLMRAGPIRTHPQITNVRVERIYGISDADIAAGA